MDRNQGDGYCSQHHVGLRSKRREEGGQVQEILPKRIVHMSMDDTLKQELLLAAQRRLQRVGITMEEMEVQPLDGSNRRLRCRLPSGQDVAIMQQMSQNGFRNDRHFSENGCEIPYSGLLNRKSHMSQGKQVLGLPPPPPPIIRTRRSFPAPHTVREEFHRGNPSSGSLSMGSRRNASVVSRDGWIDQLPQPPPPLRAQAGRYPSGSSTSSHLPLPPPPPIVKANTLNPRNNNRTYPQAVSNQRYHQNASPTIPNHPGHQNNNRAQSSVSSSSSGAIFRAWNHAEDGSSSWKSDATMRSVVKNKASPEEFLMENNNNNNKHQDFHEFARPQSSRVKADFYSILHKFNAGQVNNCSDLAAQTY